MQAGNPGQKENKTKRKSLYTCIFFFSQIEKSLCEKSFFFWVPLKYKKWDFLEANHKKHKNQRDSQKIKGGKPNVKNITVRHDGLI